jgi:linoleoyl-CoA desaturase
MSLAKWTISNITNFLPTNFKNAIVNWYTGGLNHQIEHHIFSNISTCHYGKMQKLLKRNQKCNLLLRIQDNA